MKIIIDIPDKIFHRVCQDYLNYNETTEGQALKAISEGTPLPKGHGDLIDRKELLKQPIDKANCPSNYVKIAHTIVEADKAESEEAK